MDAARFDRLTRSLTAGASRRALLPALGAALGLGPAFLLNLAEAGKRKKKRKTKKKKLQFNEFGCVNVGGKCRGKDAKCCSGICQGKKPKKGEKDKSTCVGHDESTCLPGQQLEICGGAADVACTTSAGVPGQCTTTTGNAAYCFGQGGECFPCTRDTDCQPVCGPQAACIPCVEECPATGTACLGISEESCTI